MLSDDLRKEVREKFRDSWTVRDGRTVPTEESVSLGNDGVRIDATVLYADMADSTKLVDAYDATFAAEIYGTFLRCASRIIKANEGVITAFDGDRVMAVYMGDRKEAKACWTALKINHAMIEIIRPELERQYPETPYVPAHTVGIDTSEILVIKDGVRGDNDLIWVGRAANYAAKLCALDHAYATRITSPVFYALDRSRDPGLLVTISNTYVWDQDYWAEMNGAEIFKSSCYAAAL